MENWFVVLMGMCTVFIVLILIIILCVLLSVFFKNTKKDETTSVVAMPIAQPQDTSVPNRPEFIAAVSTAIAEFSGTDASGIRIVSVKKL